MHAMMYAGIRVCHRYPIRHALLKGSPRGGVALGILQVAETHRLPELKRIHVLRCTAHRSRNQVIDSVEQPVYFDVIYLEALDEC